VPGPFAYDSQTLFATPGISVATPSQRIYWAVALPTTVLVMLIWIIWTWASMRQIDKSDSHGGKSASLHGEKDLNSCSGKGVRRHETFLEVPAEILKNTNSPTPLRQVVDSKRGGYN
jgi:hypothetical protein